MNTRHYFTATKQAFLAAVLAVVLLATSFFLVEPSVGQALVGTPFTIKQTITDEISFLLQATNVVASGTINGLTGGTANGTSTVVVKTNSFGGYNMTIAFTNNGTPNAMLGDVFASQSIHDYPAAGGIPTYNFSTASSAAVFAYTVGAVEDDISQAFRDNGAACNIAIGSGGAFTEDKCWMEPQTSSYQIIDRTSAAPTGATSTIAFRIHVPNNPSPGLVADTYTATATLTALNQ